jgi:hypothetical protein
MAKKSKLPVQKLPTNSTMVGVGPASAKPTKQELDQQRRWKAEDACRDIERAEGHKRDKALMADVKQVAQEKIDSLKRIK